MGSLTESVGSNMSMPSVSGLSVSGLTVSLGIRAGSYANTSVSDGAYEVSGALGKIRKVVNLTYEAANVGYKILSRSLQAVADGFSDLNGIFKITKVFDVVLLPISLAKIGKYATKIIRGDKEQRVNSTIDVIGEIGTFGSAASTFTMGLVHAKVLSAKTLNWATPLYVITGILSIATIFKNLRLIYQAHTMKRQLEALLGNKGVDLENFASIQEFIEKETLSKREILTEGFQNKKGKLLKSIAKILESAKAKMSSSNVSERALGEQMLQKAVKGLKGRIQFVKNSSILSATVSSINLIAAIALVLSPASIFLIAAIALGTTLNFGNLVYRKISDYHAMRDLGLKKKWYQWIV